MSRTEEDCDQDEDKVNYYASRKIKIMKSRLMGVEEKMALC